jgi:hypothetical protein
MFPPQQTKMFPFTAKISASSNNIPSKLVVKVPPELINGTTRPISISFTVVSGTMSIIQFGLETGDFKNQSLSIPRVVGSTQVRFYSRWRYQQGGEYPPAVQIYNDGAPVTVAGVIKYTDGLFIEKDPTIYQFNC